MIEHVLPRPARAPASNPSAVPAVPMTVQPQARAICVAARPTPPLAPWMKSVSPGWMPRAIVQRAPRRDVRHVDAGALREGQAIRQRVELVRLAQRPSRA